MNRCILVMQAIVNIAHQVQGSVKIDILGILSQQQGGCHGQRRPQHAANHDAKIALAGFPAQGQGFGQTSCLVQFDIDHPVAWRQPLQRCAIMATLISTEGDGTLDIGKGLVFSSGQGLFDHLDAGIPKCLLA